MLSKSGRVRECQRRTISPGNDKTADADIPMTANVLGRRPETTNVGGRYPGTAANNRMADACQGRPIRTLGHGDLGVFPLIPSPSESTSAAALRPRPLAMYPRLRASESAPSNTTSMRPPALIMSCHAVQARWLDLAAAARRPGSLVFLAGSGVAASPRAHRAPAVTESRRRAARVRHRPGRTGAGTPRHSAPPPPPAPGQELHPRAPAKPRMRGGPSRQRAMRDTPRCPREWSMRWTARAARPRRGAPRACDAAWADARVDARAWFA